MDVLKLQGEDVSKFCKDVCRALELGAVRGCNVALIGDRGCGKSMVFESFDKIFSKVMGKPDSKSSFPLTNVVDAQLLLWNEYKHKDSILLFEDLLAIAAGERIEIRIPNEKNVSVRKQAPMFLTSNSMLIVVRPNLAEMERLNNAMKERFTIRTWLKPIPMDCRVTVFPRCGKSRADFFRRH